MTTQERRRERLVLMASGYYAGLREAGYTPAEAMDATVAQYPQVSPRERDQLMQEVDNGQ